MRKKLFLTACLIAFGLLNVNAQKLEPIVIKAAYHDLSEPLRDKNPAEHNDAVKTWKDGLVKNYFGMTIPGYSPGKTTDPKSVQKENGTISPKTQLQNFEGTDNLTGVAPPDTDGDVGPNHYFQIVNSKIQIFNKTGTSLYGPVDNSTLWNGFSGAWTGTNDGDGVVLYDQDADRWFVSQFAINTSDGSQWLLVAVSQGADPTGSYYRYAFEFTNMPDYPKFGVWPDGYYVSINQFTTKKGVKAWAGAGVAALERDEMLQGNPAEMVFFNVGTSVSTLLPADCDGPFPADGTPNYFSWIDYSNDQLGVYEFDVDWANTSNSTFTNVSNLSVSAFDPDINNSINSWSRENIEQPGTSQMVHAMTDRLMFRLQYRDFGTHESMVTCHTIDVGGEQAGVRWYEMRKTTGSWSVYQEGTYAPDSDHRWMGSLAMNGNGDIALGYSVSSSSTYPSIRYTGRRVTDPLNTMTLAEDEIIAGTASQSGVNRWGDYSAMRVDPTDDETFWYTQEYSGGGWDWQTRIASFNMPATTDPYLQANAINTMQIYLNWSQNPDNDDVMIAWSPDGTFGTPLDGTTYSEGQSISGGGTVLYVGSATEYWHTGLESGTTYYYKAWSLTNANPDYSPGVSSSATTYKDLIFIDDFEDDNGWTYNGEWERTAPQGLGGDYGSPDPSAALSGTNILGLDLSGQGTYSGDYEPDLTDREEYAISPVIDCTDYGAVELKFQRWLGVESPSYDHAYIDISNDGGNTWTEIWTNDATVSDGDWTEITTDISSYADGEAQVQIRFSMGESDGSWQYCGWNIEDFALYGIAVTTVPSASISATPGCNLGSITISSNMSGDQTFFLCDQNGNVLDQATANATSHEFTDISDGIYTGKVERNGEMSSLTSQATLTNLTAPTAPTSVSATETELCNGESTELFYSGGSGTAFAWYSGSCGGTPVGTGNNLSVSPAADITYYGRWENICGESTCETVSIIVDDVIAANAGSDDMTCDGSYTMQANDPIPGTGTWSLTAGSASIDNPNDPNSNITVSSTSATFNWTIDNGSCSDTDDVTITMGTTTSVNTQPQDVSANAGTDVSFTVLAEGDNLSYQWRKDGTDLTNGGNISGANSAQLDISSVSAADAGSYDVLVSGDCGEETSDAAVLEIITGTEALNTVGISVFPNPVKDVLKIETYNARKDAKIFMTNISGQLVFKGGLYKNRVYEMNMSEYPDGIYFMTIQVDQKVYTIKIVKE